MKKLQEQAEERYGTNPHRYAQQKDGFIVGAEDQLVYVVARLRSIRRFDLDVYREGEFGIEKELRYDSNGNYIHSDELDEIINDLEKQF